MDTKIIILFALAVVVGGIVGYIVRILITIGRKGGVELEIKQKIVDAKEEASIILDESKKKAEKIENELRVLEKTKEGLIKKEELLDARQVEIDKEAELIRTRIDEVKEKYEKVLEIESKKQG